MNRPPAGDISAILGVEAGVVDLFALFRRKGEARRRNPAADARRTIAPPVSGPMFSNRIEPMNLRRAPARPAPARPIPARPEPGRQEAKKPDPKRQDRREPTPPEPAKPEPTRPGTSIWESVGVEVEPELPKVERNTNDVPPAAAMLITKPPTIWSAA